MNTGSEDMNVVCVLCLGVILSLALIVFVLVLVLVLVLVVVLFFLELAVEEVDITEVCRLAAHVEIARPEQDPVFFSEMGVFPGFCIMTMHTTIY
jgi:uncharacterized membrane protein